MNTTLTGLVTSTNTCSSKSDDTLMDKFIDELKNLSNDKPVSNTHDNHIYHIELIEQQLAKLKNNVNKLEHLENIFSFYDASLNIQNEETILDFIKEKIEALVESTSNSIKYFDQNIFASDDKTLTLEQKKGLFIKNIQPWHKELQTKLLTQKPLAITNTSTHREKNVVTSGEADTNKAIPSSNYPLAKIGTLTENNFTANPTMIQALRKETASILNNIVDNEQRNLVAATLIEAIKDKVLPIEENSKMWNPATRNSSNCSIFETNILTTLFPHSKTKKEVMNILVMWNNNLNTLPTDVFKKAIDILVKTDKAFIDRNSLSKYCQEKGLDYEQIDFVAPKIPNAHGKAFEKHDPNHFTIKNRSPDFIPADGNCGFHCLAYLLYQQQLAIQST